MARKIGTNLYEVTQYIDQTPQTNTNTEGVCVLNRDWAEIVQFSVNHSAAGVGAQNVTYVLKVGSTAVTSTTGNVANATKDATATATGLGVLLNVLTEGSRLDMTCTYAGAVTSGAKITLNILYRA